MDFTQHSLLLKLAKKQTTETTLPTETTDTGTGENKKPAPKPK